MNRETHYMRAGGAHGSKVACGQFIVSSLDHRLPYSAIAAYEDIPAHLRTGYLPGRRESLPSCSPCARAYKRDRDALREACLGIDPYAKRPSIENLLS